MKWYVDDAYMKMCDIDDDDNAQTKQYDIDGDDAQMKWYDVSDDNAQ